MAIFKYPEFLIRSEHEVFDKTFQPAAETPYSGIYRCRVCGHEIVSTKRHPLPPQDHHTHEPGKGKIEWQLVVTHHASIGGL